MIKTAVFVEGQTELIFVRELVKKSHYYQGIRVQCFKHIGDSNMQEVPYAFGPIDAENYFQIFDIGNDASVVSAIRNREENMFKAGFHRIIGLRDMYSKAYLKTVSSRIIDSNINQRFIESQNKMMFKLKNSEKISLCFAIMETEAWFLGMYRCFQKVDARLTPVYISEVLKLDLITDDPERTVFHPANYLERIYENVGQKYEKSKSNTEVLMSGLNVADFNQLRTSGRCHSFSELCNALKI